MRQRRLLVLIAAFVVVSALILVLRSYHKKQDNPQGSARSSEFQELSGGSDVELSGIARAERDVVYGSDPAQRLDVYMPTDAPENAPVIFMVHGGAWRLGDKGNANTVTNKVLYWVPRGYVFVSINYRMLPEADPLTQANDVAKALAYVQAHAEAWGANPAKIIAMGHSAGAHLIALVASDQALAANNNASPWLGTVLLDSAALDIVSIMSQRHYDFYDKAFGSSRSYWEQASPLQRLTAAPRPLF